MTPPHGVELKSTAEREAAKTEEQAHMHRCEKEEGGPVYELKQEIKAMGEKFDAMKTFVSRVAGALVLTAIVLPLAVTLWIHYHPRPVSQAPALISQAHAEERKSP